MSRTKPCQVGASTPKKLANLKPPFEPGKSGNPAGRPKGSRNKLSEAFIEALCADFQEHGAETIERVRIEDPATYIRVIAGLLPKEVNIDSVRELTDEQLDERIRSLSAALGLEIMPRRAH